MRKKSKSSVGLSFFSEKKWNDALSLILSAILIVVVARDTFRFWWWEYTAPESYYSHAFLVPLLIGFILWAHRERIAKVEFCPCYGAAIFVAAMAFVNIMAARNEMQAVMSYSLLGLLVSSACLLMGTRFVWREKVAFAFLIAMLPLPGPLLNDMTFGLQNISTAGAAWFLNQICFDCQRTG
jgi:exosortase